MVHKERHAGLSNDSVYLQGLAGEPTTDRSCAFYLDERSCRSLLSCCDGDFFNAKLPVYNDVLLLTGRG